MKIRASRDKIIDKIKMLSEESLTEVADFLDQIDVKRKEMSKVEGDLLSSAIGICEAPTDLAKMHDKCTYE